MGRKEVNNMKSGISLLLVIVIVGAILAGVLVLADIMIRQTKITQGFDFSEKAFMNAEIAKEKVAYNVNKNFCLVDNGCATSTDDYSAVLSVDDKNPNTGKVINNSNPWQIDLQSSVSSSASFIIALDLNSQAQIYPNSITISQSTSSSGELIVWRCKTKTTGIKECNPNTVTSTTYVSFPQRVPETGDLNIPDYYYKLRINNTDTTSTSYILKPSDHSLPIGVIINSTGIFKDYQRRTKFTLPKWQIFGGD